jgi:Uncharacterized protein conserved in bacteria
MIPAFSRLRGLSQVSVRRSFLLRKNRIGKRCTTPVWYCLDSPRTCESQSSCASRWLKLEGAVGLRDGLALLKGSLERYWPDLYPKLDPEENNDPLERINIIARFQPRWVRLATRCVSCSGLREIPLANSPQWDGLASQISGDKITLPNGQEKPGASAAQIKAAFRDTKQEELEGCGRAILDSIVLAKDIDRFLMETVGPAQAPDMGALTTILTIFRKTCSLYVESSRTNAS